MYPNYEARLEIINTTLIAPLLSWCVPPSDLIDDEPKQRMFMSLLAQDANSELPADMTADEIKLACQKAFKDLRRSMKRRFWPENSMVIQAMADAVVNRSPRATLVIDNQVAVQGLALWIAQQELPALISNANHYRRAHERKPDNAAFRIVAEMLENEIAKRREKLLAEDFDAETATVSAIVDRWRVLNQHRSYGDMTDAELLERRAVFERFGMLHAAYPKFKAEIARRGL